MAIQTQWKIRAHAHECALTGKRFEDGQVFFTCLSDTIEDDGFLREDFSEEAWNQVRHEKRPFSFWRSVYEVEPPVDPEADQPLRQNDAESLLLRLMEEDSPETENTRYILALMLERKRRLRPVGQKESDDRRMLLYEQAGTGEVLLITDPQIRLDQVDAIEAEVRALLESQSEPQESTPADSADGSDEAAPGEGEMPPSPEPENDAPES